MRFLGQGDLWKHSIFGVSNAPNWTFSNGNHKVGFAAVVKHDIHGNKNTERKQVQPTKGKVEPFRKHIVSNTGRHKKHVRGTPLPCVENVFL